MRLIFSVLSETFYQLQDGLSSNLVQIFMLPQQMTLHDFSDPMTFHLAPLVCDVFSQLLLDVIRAGYWQEFHDTICIMIQGSHYDYVMKYCDTLHIALCCNVKTVCWKCKTITSRYIDNLTDKLRQNNLFKISFPIYLNGIGKLPHTHLHSCRNIEMIIHFNWTQWDSGHTEIQSMTIKCICVLLCHWTLRLSFSKDLVQYISQYMGHDTDITKMNAVICCRIDFFSTALM